MGIFEGLSLQTLSCIWFGGPAVARSLRSYPYYSFCTFGPHAPPLMMAACTHTACHACKLFLVSQKCRGMDQPSVFFPPHHFGTLCGRRPLLLTLCILLGKQKQTFFPTESSLHKAVSLNNWPMRDGTGNSNKQPATGHPHFKPPLASLLGLQGPPKLSSQ